MQLVVSCKNYVATLRIVNLLCSQGYPNYVSRYPMGTDSLL